MKKDQLLAALYRYATPAAMVALGALLMLFPDSVSAMAGKLLGWALIVLGVGFILSAVFGSAGAARVLAALVCLAAGCWLLRNPMMLAKGIGRFVGALLLIRGVQDVLQSADTRGRSLSALVAVVGLVLILLPMTTSRVVFSLCGLAVLLVGAALFADRWRTRHFTDGDGGPDIIDAL